MARHAAVGVCMAVIGLVFPGCGQATTDSLLSAEFMGQGQARIDLLFPAADAATDKNPVFTWAAKNGIGIYKLEISSSSDFSAAVLEKEISGASYALADSDLKGLTQLNPVAYYWRVSAAKILNNMQSTARRFFVREKNVLYVSAASSEPVQAGNQTAPYRSIQLAIAQVDEMRAGNTAITYDIRVASGTYNEDVQLKAGVRLYGGYNAAGWARDVAANKSLVRGLNQYAVQCANIALALRDTTVVDGFELVAPTTGTAVIFADQCALTVSGNTIRGEDIPTQVIGISVSNAAPVISRNYFRLSTPSVCTGIKLTAANAIVASNRILVSAPTNTYGLDLQNASPVITNNVITVNNGSNAASGIRSADQSAPVISNNTIWVNGVTSPTLAASAIELAGAPAGSAGSRITNNLFVMQNNNKHFGIYESDTAYARSVENNAYWSYTAGATSWFAYRNTVNSCGGTQTCSIAQMEALSDWQGGSDKARGNFFLTNGAAGNPFTNTPVQFEILNANGTQTTAYLPAAGTFTNGHYIEIDGDGVPRQVFIGGGSTTLSFLPPRASITRTGMEIRNWGTNSTNLQLNLNLLQNSLTTQEWNNIRFGGKNTGGNNCGAPGGGPGTCAGGEDCGAVTSDLSGAGRTPGGAAGAVNANADGYAIGAYERD